MENYVINGNVIEITLKSGKVVKVDKNWADQTMKALDLDLDETLQMFLEDNDYLLNRGTWQKSKRRC